MSEKRELILTSSGVKRIEAELDQLQSVRRQEVANHIRDAMAFGDIAENPEYESAKNEQAFVEGRIIELKSILNVAHVVDDTQAPTDVVGIGSVVTVRDLEMDEEWDYTIVGSVEADPDEVRNLAADPQHRSTLESLRKQVHEFRKRTKDPWLINDREGKFSTP